MATQQRTILLVEPEPVLAEVTAFRLELLGYRVNCVPSGEAAMGEIGRAVPDLLITDLILPGLDGKGLIERLATDEATADLPIMVLSVDADLAQVQTVFQLGATDFVVVPFHPEVLEEKVAKLLASAPVRAAAPPEQTTQTQEQAVAAK